MMTPKSEEIIHALELKSSTKQFIYRKTKEVFDLFRVEIKSIVSEVGPAIHQKDKYIEVITKDSGNFETEMQFSGDTLLFMMHTNVFNFPPDNFVHKTNYIKEDPMRSYCGVINIYNFLSDSLRYGRMNDVGYLIARIFINKEGHFMVQGKRQFSFMYNDITQFEINPAAIRAIIEEAILNTISFDLFVPPFDAVKEISLGQKINDTGNTAIKTGKRLGFDQSED
ncbi:MAG: hypothetical protein NTX03_00285 [Bacteroidetes bacterium]|nr:hypothetical protein [Bacteroidota bacterium]